MVLPGLDASIAENDKDQVTHFNPHPRPSLPTLHLNPHPRPSLPTLHPHLSPITLTLTPHPSPLTLHPHPSPSHAHPTLPLIPYPHPSPSPSPLTSHLSPLTSHPHPGRAPHDALPHADGPSSCTRSPLPIWWHGSGGSDHESSSNAACVPQRAVGSQLLFWQVTGMHHVHMHAYIHRAIQDGVIKAWSGEATRVKEAQASHACMQPYTCMYTCIYERLT